MRSPEYFELWGYPGAGKSSQARLLKANGVPVVDLPRRRSLLTPSLTAAQLLQSREVFWGFARGVLQPSHPEARIARTAMRQMATFKSDPPLVIEEGIIHEIWRAAYRSPTYRDEGRWRNFLDLAGPHVIVLDIAPSEALARMQQKEFHGSVNRELAASSIGDTRWDRAERAYATVLSALHGCPAIHVHSIDVGGKSLERACDEIRALIDSICTAARA